MMLEFLDPGFSICKLTSRKIPDIRSEFMVFGRTDRETSLVCPTPDVPDDVSERNDGGREQDVDRTSTSRSEAGYGGTEGRE